MSIYERMNKFAKKIVSLFLPNIIQRSGRVRYLEVGFGRGGEKSQLMNLNKALRQDWEVHGIESNKTLVKRARRKYPGALFTFGDVISGTKFDTDHFAFISFNDVLGFVANRDVAEYNSKRLAFFTELKRILKNNGFLMFQDHDIGAREFVFRDPSNLPSWYKKWELSLDVIHIANKLDLKVLLANRKNGLFVFQKPY